MNAAVIAFPSQIWCVGAQALLSSCGWEVAGSHTSAMGALEALSARPAGLLVIAKGLIDQIGGGGPGALAAAHSGKIAVVLEEGASLSWDDFVAWKVEGLILGSASETAFRECFGELRQDGCWVDPDIREVLGKVRARPGPPPLSSLSEREQEVAQLAAEGLSNKQIARAMGVSDGTIKMHMHHILTKFHLTSRIELVGLADGADPGPRPARNRPALRLIGG